MSHEIKALCLIDPDRARAKILATLRQTGMHRGDACVRLGCSRVTLIRWIAELGLGRTIEAMAARAEREGWHHTHRGGRPRSAAPKDEGPRRPRGRPKGSTVANGAARPRLRVPG